MIVNFSSDRLQKVLSRERLIKQKYGEDCARKIMTRLGQLQNSDNWADLILQPGRWHELSGSRKGQWAADLKQPLRLITRPISSQGEIRNWTLVIEVEVIEIIDYHD